MNKTLLSVANYLSETNLPRYEWSGIIVSNLAPLQRKVYEIIKLNPHSDTLDISNLLTQSTGSSPKLNQIGNIVSELMKLHLVQRELGGGIFRYSCKE